MTKKNDNKNMLPSGPAEKSVQELLIEAMSGKITQNHKQGKMRRLLNWLLRKAQGMSQFLDACTDFIVGDKDADPTDVMQVARKPILFGVYIIIIFVIMGGVWSATAPLDSAAHASGKLIPATKRKQVQHLKGGIVHEIFVTQGSHVKAGDPIIALDSTNDKASYDANIAQLRILIGNESRLLTEIDGKDKIAYPFDDIFDKNALEVQSVITTQDQLLASKMNAHHSKTNALSQRIEQSRQQLEGLGSRLPSATKNVALFKEKVENLRKLYNNGYVNKSQLLDTDAKLSEYEAQLSGIQSEIIKAKEVLAEAESNAASYKNEYISRLFEELKDTQGKKRELQERYNNFKDALDRVVLRAPVDGEIVYMTVATVGGIVRPSDVLAEILPDNDRLVIEVMIPQKNRDSVYKGMPAKVKFTAFKSRTTPVFNGVLTSISADTIEDRNSMAAAQQNASKQAIPDGSAYIGTIELNMDEFNKVAKERNLELHAGMRVDVQIITGERTLLRYLLDPVVDSMFNAFRER